MITYSSFARARRTVSLQSNVGATIPNNIEVIFVLFQILEDVCKKHKLNPSEYDIKHHNNTLDTTVLMQFSGLPNNAQLEMSPAVKVRQETEVVLCMQLENGERLMGNFQPGTVLWDVVLKLCPGEAEANNIVIIYMRNELIGKENLLATPLRSLGITGGRAMVRLVHRYYIHSFPTISIGPSIESSSRITYLGF